MYRAIVTAHIACGVIALVTYWMAGLSKKGSPLHRGAGKAYLLSMIGVVASSVVMAGFAFAREMFVIATFLAYLVVITTTAMALGWLALRRKRDQAGYRGTGYRAGAVANVASGLAVFAFGIQQGDALLMGFSWVGIIIGGQMLWRAWKPLAETKWWLREHIGAMLGCGVATHIAFLGIGIRRLTDALGVPVDLGLVAWFAPVAVSFLAGLWLERKYLAAPARRSVAVTAG
ncbi:hypothetical protein [Silanimonas sp.]|jgi:hypothetical protein|uniref:hypothetical protein n=1 Tax=Silanimonas sp. TaxID=1929290 RepID=UPI0037CC271B